VSHFYASITESARNNAPTACGNKRTGISTYAASRAGRISVDLRHNDATGEDTFTIRMESHDGHGDTRELLYGTVGNAKSVKAFPHA